MPPCLPRLRALPALLALGSLLCAAASCRDDKRADAPAGERAQPTSPSAAATDWKPRPLATLASFDELRALFNADQGKARMVVLLEPG